RRPGWTTAVSVGMLMVIALPALDLRLTSASVEMLPADADQRIFFEKLDRDFPIVSTPTVSVVAQASLPQARKLAKLLYACEEMRRKPIVRRFGPAPKDVDAAGLKPNGSGMVVVNLLTPGGTMGERARDVASVSHDRET